MKAGIKCFVYSYKHRNANKLSLGSGKEFLGRIRQSYPVKAFKCFYPIYIYVGALILGAIYM
jgi:hypothetical protein